MSFLAIRIRGKATHTGAETLVSTRAPEPEIDAAMASQGISPDRVNTIRWPAIGASRWSTATVLMHSDDVASLASIQYNGGVTGGPTIYVDLLYHDLVFPQMLVGKVTPILATEATRGLFLVELHDRRWLWRQVRARGPRATDDIDNVQGYNIASLARGRYVERTTVAGTPWTPKAIVERVLAGDAAAGIPALQLSTDVYVGEVGSVTGLPLTDTANPGWDFDTDDNAGQFIDRVLAKAGAVFAFTPSSTGGKTYDIGLHHIGSGEDRGLTLLNDYGTHLVAGGFETVVDTGTVSGWTTGAKQYAFASREIVRRDCPQKVRVYFPFALAAHDETALYTTDGCAHDHRFGSLVTWDSDSGRPTGFGSAPDTNSPALYHIVDDTPLVTRRSGEADSSELLEALAHSNRAEQVAIAYYQRFSAGCCDMWIRGAVPLTSATVWSGGQIWTWEARGADDLMPFVTHIEGDRNCPLFGFTPNDSNPIHGLGTVTAFKGPDGSLRVIGNVVGHIPIMIRTKGATPTVGKDNQWDYECKILQRDSTETGGWIEWADIAGKNSIERNNTATFAGPGWKLPLSAPGTWNVLPIGEDRDGTYHDQDIPAFLVEDRSLSEDPIAVFAMANAIDGGCP